MIGIRIFIMARPEWAPLTGEKFTWRDKFQSLNRVWAVALLALVVIGGLYVGLFAPSAAGAVGAAGATLIAAFMGRLTLRDFWDSLLEAARITTVLFLIFIGGLLLSRALVVMGFISEVNGLVELYGMTPGVFIALVIVVYVVLGIFIDSVSMMVITMPLLFPMSQALQIDPIWFLVLIIKLATIAEITPPVGLNLFAVLGSAGGKINARQLFIGVLPFVALDVVFLVALVLFPAIATWLPAQMKG
jgi:TRAP-type C4-dicarboxylate transport system permease large subunit